MAELFTIKQQENLHRFLISAPRMNRVVKKAIAIVLKEARKNISKDAKDVVGSGYPNSGGDTREAYRAIKHQVYRKILGGNVSLLNKRKAGKVRWETDHVDRANKRGGNRIRRVNDDRNRLSTYYGADRAFVLRFINQGTTDRLSRYGNRGSIHARPFFDVSSAFHMRAAAEKFERMVNEEIIKATQENG